MALDVLTIEVETKGKRGKVEGPKECLNLAVIFSATGTIHVFRLLSDEELFLYEFSYRQLQRGDGSVGGSLEVLNGILNSVLPSNMSKMTVSRSEVRVRLPEIADFSTRSGVLSASSVEITKDSMLQASLSKLATLDVFDTRTRNKATADSVLRGLPYLAFIQQMDPKQPQLLSVLCESGWYMKFSVQIDEFIDL